MSNSPIKPNDDSGNKKKNDQNIDNTPESKPKNQDENLEFVITEAHSEGPENIGGFKNQSEKAEEIDELGLESTADIMEKEARGETSLPINNGCNKLSLEPNPNKNSHKSTGDHGSERFAKLPEKRIQEISKQMKREKESDGYLTQQEKYDLINGMGKTKTSVNENKKNTMPDFPEPKNKAKSKKNTAIQKVDQTNKKGPKIAERVRGIAYFTHQFIQVTGEQILHDQDEMVINGRAYLLKPKKVSNRLLWSVLGPLAAILIFSAGTFFSSDANTGLGQIVGVVVDDQGAPLITGATIRIVDIGESVKSNAQGFFKTDPIDAGSHKIEFVVNGEVIGTDYATVVDGEVTTLMIHPSEDEITKPSWSTGTRSGNNNNQSNIRNQNSPAKAISTPKATASVSNSVSTPKSKTTSQSKPKATAKKKTNSKKSTPAYSKLKLGANISGAKLILDGSVIGAGNLTYSRLKPGKHKYQVSKEGFQTKSGTIDLKAGKVNKLDVVLASATPEEKQKTYLEQDYYHSGINNLENRNLTAALEDFSEAIRIDPSYSSAYIKRAATNLKLSKSDDAYDDYIRAAEISQINRENSKSLSAYNKAVDIKKKSIPALLGRGNLYLLKGQEIAAIADFDYIIRLDKRNLQAYLGLGEARFNQGYHKKAIKHFKDARSIAPKDPVIHQNLMLCYLNIGDMKNVKKSYEKFQKYASEQQAQRIQSDPKYSDVLEIVNR